jgi:general stress protein 26
MTQQEPTVELDARYSSPGATTTPWAEAAKHLKQAEIFWLSTVRPDGRPHVTPLVAVWVDDALYFSTGAEERKAKNLAHNTHCILTTGRNTLNEEGLDLVLEGTAVQLSDEERLQRIADAYEAKYGKDWHYDVGDGALIGDQGNVALVFEVAPTSAFGFGKGATFSQTRWRF